MSISISFTAARTSGVAPLNVFCDATATTSTATTRPFHDLLYVWDFGDPAGGATWGNGARSGLSKNVAYGPVAGHCFETAGSYTITLHVYDGTDTASTTASITVSDADTVFSGTNTICFETSATGTGGPAGCSYVTTSDFDSAINSNVGTGKRLLFKRGQTFVASTAGLVTVTGPGIIGAWSSGAKPAITTTGSPAAMLSFGGQSFPNSSSHLKDWRVMDLSFNGGNNAECISCEGGFDQLTYLRVDGTNGGDAIFMFNGDLLAFWNNNGHPTHNIWTELAIIECNPSDPSGWSTYVYAKNFTFLGNNFDNATNGSHTLRMITGINGVMSSNLFQRNGISSPSGNHCLKFHAPIWATGDVSPPNTFSEKVVFSDNKFDPSDSSVNNWTVSIDPQDNAEDERIRNILFERNWLTGGTNTSIGVSVQAVDITLRNNVCDSSLSAAGGQFTQIDKRSTGAPAPDRIGIYNNTCYSSTNNINTTDSAFISVTSSVVSGGATIRNNLGYAPNATSPGMVDDSASSTKSNNSTNGQVKSTNPNFVSGSPSAYADFAIQTTSYAKAGGTNITNYYDGFDRSRVGVTNDMGFYQFNAGSDPFGGGGASVVIPGIQPRMVFHLS